MDRKDREQINRQLTDLHHRATELARHVKVLADQTQITGEDAWRFAFRTQEDMRSLAASLMNISRRLIELQCARLRQAQVSGAPTLDPGDVGVMTTVVLRDYFGYDTPLFSAMYAALAAEEVSEEDPAVVALVEMTNQELEKAGAMPYADRLFFVDAISLGMAALAARSQWSTERAAEFVTALEAMLRHLSRPDDALELLGEYGGRDALV